MTDSTNAPHDDQPRPAMDDATDRTATAPPVQEDSDGAGIHRDERRRGILVPVIAAAVVAALLGGGVGAGIALAVNPTRTVATAETSGDRSGVVIDDPATATAVSSVAQKASPSVVTIAVSDGDTGGTGSGIVLSADGYVLTNNHVVSLGGAATDPTIQVSTSNGRLYDAEVVGADPLNDLAVIRLQKASGLTPATFADSADLNVGEPVVAIGAPLDLPNTVTTGIVSALGRSIAVASSAAPQDPGQGGEDSPFNFWNFGNGSEGTQPTSNIYLSVLQTDAAINPGNSGGALLNDQGEVIGVNVAIARAASSTDGQSGSIGVGFAIPSSIARRIADTLIAGDDVTHGQLGVTSQAAGSSTTGGVAGVPVQEATAGGAAADAGIEAGDVITAVGGVPVTDYTDLAGQVRAYPGGETVDVTFVRDGKAQTVSVTLGTIEA